MFTQNRASGGGAVCAGQPRRG
ncbi:hypothetical protein [Antricoccus suffuscus]